MNGFILCQPLNLLMLEFYSRSLSYLLEPCMVRHLTTLKSYCNHILLVRPLNVELSMNLDSNDSIYILTRNILIVSWNCKLCITLKPNLNRSDTFCWFAFCISNSRFTLSQSAVFASYYLTTPAFLFTNILMYLSVKLQTLNPWFRIPLGVAGGPTLTLPLGLLMSPQGSHNWPSLLFGVLSLAIPMSDCVSCTASRHHYSTAVRAQCWRLFCPYSTGMTSGQASFGCNLFMQPLPWPLVMLPKQ